MLCIIELGVFKITCRLNFLTNHMKFLVIGNVVVAVTVKRPQPPPNSRQPMRPHMNPNAKKPQRKVQFMTYLPV